jgi:ABC-type bacteriocin/lantibiotic exporter with double-glycine peptidase domain
MNIIIYLIEKFFYEEIYKSTFVLAISLLTNLFQINGISFITATIIKSIENKNYKLSFTYFAYFIGMSFLFIFLFTINKYVQNHLLTKMTQWIKHEVLRIILLTNDENFSDTNFIEFITPITRISVSCYVIFSSILLTVIPSVAFLTMIGLYFLYKDIKLGMFFLIANIFVVYYLYYYWAKMLSYKNIHETQINENEKYIINLLNNIDKVIYRGESHNEIDIFNEKTNEGIKKAMTFNTYTQYHILIATIMVLFIIFICIATMIYLSINKLLDSTTFIGFFTILLLYRDKMNDNIQEVPHFLEFTGRLTYILEEFKNMLGNNQVTDVKLYKNISIPFNKIRFENVSYTYTKTDKKIFENTNITLNTKDKIIGITGLSGNGKSTLAKMIIKMYKPTSGKVFIDDIDVAEIDPLYIRKNITYVNQNSKLFDKVIIDNMMYGCNDKEQCKTHFTEIMKYPKITQLYRNIDIYNKKTGSLGEKISGGQRQVVNIISGLINPTKILILDEPTNALDPELKKELLQIIKEFKKYKQAIIIITHDKEVYPLFDETIHM